MFLRSRQVRFRQAILPSLAERSSTWLLLDRNINPASCAQREAAAASAALAPITDFDPHYLVAIGSIKMLNEILM